MALPEHLTLEPIPHPVPRIHRTGFPLDHPYLEHCWGPSLGPTCVLLLRRAAWLWREETPTVVRSAEFARMLGVGPGTGSDSALAHTVERLDRFRLATWDPESGHLAVYTEVPPQIERHLRRLPAATQRLHEELLAEHLDALARTASAPAQEAAERMAGRLERLERAAPGFERTLGR